MKRYRLLLHEQSIVQYLTFSIFISQIIRTNSILFCSLRKVSIHLNESGATDDNLSDRLRHPSRIQTSLTLIEAINRYGPRAAKASPRRTSQPRPMDFLAQSWLINKPSFPRGERKSDRYTHGCCGAY